MDNQVLNNMTSINDIIVFFKRHKHTIISFGFIIAICTALFACLMQPIYRSTTSILIDSRQSNILDNTAILSNLGSDSSVIDSQVEIIRSPSLLSRVARKERLYQRQDFYKSSHSVLTVIGILLGIHKTEANYINADTSSSILLQIEQNRPTETSFIYDWISLVFPKPELQTLDTIKERVIQKLQENLTVKRQGKSLILLVSYESPNSALSTKIVNRIAQEYLNDQLETKLEATKRATNWLTERLSSLRNELKIKEATIAVFKQKNNLFGASKITQIEQQVTKLNEQLINANVETVEKLARYNQVKALARNGSLQSYSGFVSSGTVSNLRVQESRALGIVAHLSGKYGENHPQLINARAKLHDIRKQINDEANRMIDNAKSEYNIAHRRESSLKASLDTLKGQFDITGTQSVRLQQLEREAEAARTAYETISERFRETDKSDEIQQSDAYLHFFL